MARGHFKVAISLSSEAKLIIANITATRGGKIYVSVGTAPVGSVNSINATAVQIKGMGSGGFVYLRSVKGYTYQVTSL